MKLYKMDTAIIRNQLAQHLRNGKADSALDLISKLQTEDLKQKDEDGYAPLHHAARLNNNAVLESLLEKLDIEGLRCTDSHGNTALHYATMEVSDSGVKAVERILEKADRGAVELLRVQNKNQNTAIHHAVIKGNKEALRRILDPKYATLETAVNVQNNMQRTALHIAASHSDGRNMITPLLDAGADITIKDSQGSTPFLVACTRGDPKILQLLFDRKNEVVGDTDNEGNTCLSIVAQFANESTDIRRWKEVTNFCLDRGATADKHNKLGRYPLHWAAMNNSSSIIKLLLEKGKADLFDVDTRQNTALHMAAYRDDSVQAMVKLMENLDKSNKKKLLESKNMDSLTPLLLACTNGHQASVDILLKEGADIWQTDKDRRTVFHMAVKGNNQTILEMLIDFAEDKSDDEDLKNMFQPDQTGNTLMHVAAQYGYSDILQYLTDYRCGEMKFSVSDYNMKKQTPFHLAAEAGKTDAVKIMLKEDMDAVKHVDDGFNTALHLAAKNGHIDVCLVLIDKKADVEAKNAVGYTPLHFAVRYGWTKTIEVLLENEANTNIKDSNGDTSLHLAAAADKTKILKKLLQEEWKTDVSIENKDSKTAMDVAIDNESPEMSSTFLSSCALDDLLKDRGTINRDRINLLIGKQPDVATKLFDRCITQNGDKCEYSYNYEYLNMNISEKENRFISAIKFFWPFNGNATSYIKNHPLNVMVKYGHQDLLEHDIVRSLLQYKWNSRGLLFYTIAIVLHLVDLAILTSYLLLSTPYYSRTMSCEELVRAKVERNSFLQSAGTVIIVFASLNILKEIWRMMKDRLDYIKCLENWIDLGQYVTEILFVLNYEDCQDNTDYRYSWQWNCGLVAVYLAWVNVSFMLQRLDIFGIYMVMFQKVLFDIVKFVFIFCWFIFGFSFAFYAGIQNQNTFATYGRSLAKTAVMMIGEYDYDDIFVDGDVFPYITINLVFFLFIFVMTIIIMNLMIGLALENIQDVRKQAMFTEKRMRIDFLLEIESMFQGLIPFETDRETRKRETKEETTLSEQTELRKLQRRVATTLEHIKTMSTRLEKVEIMIQALVEKLDVEVPDHKEEEETDFIQ